MDRAEHVQWSKDRALEYLDAGDLPTAVASMTQDMNLREDTTPPPVLLQLAMLELMKGDRDGVRRWIEGFN